MHKIEGDPKIVMSSGGYDLVIIDGQPTMDEGLENAVTISLWGDSDWWANGLESDDGVTGSVFTSILNRTLTNKTRQDTEALAQDALAWMVSDGIASKINTAATIPAVGRLDLEIGIVQPDKTVTIKYQINWAAMSVRVGAAA